MKGSWRLIVEGIELEKKASDLTQHKGSNRFPRDPQKYHPTYREPETFIKPTRAAYRREVGIQSTNAWNSSDIAEASKNVLFYSSINSRFLEFSFLLSSSLCYPHFKNMHGEKWIFIVNIQIFNYITSILYIQL